MTIQKMHDIPMYLDGDEIFEDAKRTSGIFEPESVKFWLDHCKAGQAALDVGAYTGLFTFLAARAGCHAYGFEPNPLCYERAVDNLNLNSFAKNKWSENVNLLPNAVSKTKEEKYFYYNVNNLSSVGSLKPVDHPAYAAHKVQALSLDWDFMLNYPICAIKIDTEGFEQDVLDGAVNILKQWKPALIIELLTMEHIKIHSDYLRQFGYTRFERIDDRNLVCEA